MKLCLYFRIKASTQHSLDQLFQINSLQSRFELVLALICSVNSCWISCGEEYVSYSSVEDALAEVSMVKTQTL